MIHSVYVGDDSDLVQIILGLHSRGPGNKTILDATFGHGGFWRGRPRDAAGGEIIGLDRRMATGDLELARSNIKTLVSGDYEQMPFKAGIFDVVMFDPPFLTRGGEGSKIKQWYTAFDSYDGLIISLQRAKIEIARVLKPKGFVVVKCMDWTEGRRRRWMHVDLINEWIPRFRLDDLIVKVAVQNMRNPGWKHQERSKAAHVYFLVFKLARMSRDAGARDLTLPLPLLDP